MNLIINAEQAIAETTKHKGKIMVETSMVRDGIRISIADSGPGISEENITRIFDPFFTTKDVGSGTGLGLSICHGIITEHGGNIYVESQKGKGATFVVELPLKEEAVVEEDILYGGEAARRAGGVTSRWYHSILIVDDEPAIRDVLARILSEEGYRTDCASNAKAALKKLAENSYELYIIDLKMPQMSGREPYEIMKQRYPDSAKRVVFITGDTLTSATQDFLDSIGKPYLTKPFDFKELIKVVRGTLSVGNEK